VDIAHIEGALTPLGQQSGLISQPITTLPAQATQLESGPCMKYREPREKTGGPIPFWKAAPPSYVRDDSLTRSRGTIPLGRLPRPRSPAILAADKIGPGAGR
jgi:hypothetical protein